MRITIQHDKLSQFLSRVEKVAGKNPSLPILNCVLFDVTKDELCMRATNLDLGVEARIVASNAEEGRIAVPANILSSYVNQLSGEKEITLSTKEGNFVIESSKGRSLIKAFDHSDFPTLPKVEDGTHVTLESKNLVEGLKSVWYSASVSNMKPELSSVYIYSSDSYLTFVSTDSFRLAEKKVQLQKRVDIAGLLIPQRNVTEIIRVLDTVEGELKVTFDKNQISFESRSIYLVSRVIDATFPDYKQIIPKESVTDVVVLKQDLVQALRLSTLFSDSFNQVHFSVAGQDSLLVSCKNNERGENENSIPATISGEELEINFNHRYVMDCMQSIHSDSITLKFSGAHKALVIKGVSDPSFLYLVMPMNR
jgi:DNA polymerase-3 subunit beta